jgi:hypothetical protein
MRMSPHTTTSDSDRLVLDVERQFQSDVLLRLIKITEGAAGLFMIIIIIHAKMHM